MEKMQAHVEGKMHRAFSVFLFNENKEILLQRRALSKYHSGGLYTNACCSHPRKGESVEAAAHRRLKEELGIDCEVEEVYQFTYHAELDHNMIEHEYDHVLIGEYNGSDIPFNLEEVDQVIWIPYAQLKEDMEAHPDKYTQWFRIIMDNVSEAVLFMK
jgi:isopentenyl-diphosphate delta-isomerase